MKPMKIKKSQKPIEIEVSLKYRCPNENCGFYHWLFLREVKASQFKVVCECGTIFRPKRIKNIRILYDKPAIKKQTVDKPELPAKMTKESNFVSRAVNMMVALGYTEKEAKKYVNLVNQNQEESDSVSLVKKAISKIGEL